MNPTSINFQEIHRRVSAVKPVSVTQLYRYLKACKITHVGANQRPQRYPEGAAVQILEHLGLASGNGSSAEKLPTMEELRRERKKARRGK